MPGYTVIATVGYFVEAESKDEASNIIYETLLGNGDTTALGDGEIACTFVLNGYQRIINDN